ncbi:Voltage-dependent N-type calcium channel subunit alpha-1B [Frankliniella fusca]|uniref:Voltage-dependent N-type calcium channel subunit alpha-1B n=1 Tax=Frankliniella fusca TaxID=407009 RepID=A0AAE1H315_9NEOP|nr:Voltage-dependent N-type calcium channel subunit alpha-1B [Frankliniella fusca]
MMKFVLVALLVVALACVALAAPLDSDPTNPIKSEDYISGSDPNGLLLLKKKLLLGKVLLLG